jgi:hypothetical protein
LPYPIGVEILDVLEIFRDGGRIAFSKRVPPASEDFSIFERFP